MLYCINDCIKYVGIFLEVILRTYYGFSSYMIFIFHKNSILEMLERCSLPETETKLRIYINVKS